MSDAIYTEGIAFDGAAILKDGVPITITEILQTLNENSRLRAELHAANEALEILQLGNKAILEDYNELLEDYGCAVSLSYALGD